MRLGRSQRDEDADADADAASERDTCLEDPCPESKRCGSHMLPLTLRSIND